MNHVMDFYVFAAHCTLNTSNYKWHLHMNLHKYLHLYLWYYTLNTTHWTLCTVHHTFILPFARLSLHAVNIQYLPEWHYIFTWQNKHDLHITKLFFYLEYLPKVLVYIHKDNTYILTINKLHFSSCVTFVILRERSWCHLRLFIDAVTTYLLNSPKAVHWACK